MKTSILTSILAALVTVATAARPQQNPSEYLGLPGDNLNLYAVMKLFQESETLEGFERKLNAEDSRINNLDLNGDNLIDYITVTDYPDGDDHTIVLRVPMGRNDFQDVAVFTVQKFRDGSVQIQLIGDEALYGKNYIIEPVYDETPNPGYMGRPESRTYVTVVRTTPYEIAVWPLIRFIYMPGYVVWHSSWYWDYYPDWWRPWRPYYWHYYYGYHYNWYNDYYAHYRHWDYCRWSRYNDFYYHGVRAHSPVIEVNITKNVYRNTYSHPEQRKEGEALYTRLNPDRPARSEAARRPENTAGRQQASTSRPAAQSASSSDTRRPDTGTGRETARPASQERSTSASRPAASSSGRTEYKSDPGRSGQSARTAPATKTQTSADRRPATTSSQTVSKPASQQRSTAASRPSSSSSGKSQNVRTAPTSRSSQSAKSSSSSASRSSATRSSTQSRSSSSSSSSKSSGKSGDNERRR